MRLATLDLNSIAGPVQETVSSGHQATVKTFRKENLTDISQRTIALMIPLFDHLGFYDRTFTKDLVEHQPLLSNTDLSNSLAAAGFDNTVLEHFESRHWNFRGILPELRDGSFADHFVGQNLPEHSHGHYLLGLATTLDGIYQNLGMSGMAAFAAFKQSLQNDGYVPNRNQPATTEMSIVDIPAELSLLEQTIDRSRHDDKAALANYFTVARKEFDNGRWGPSMGEWRKFFGEILRGVWRFTRLNNGRAGALVEKPPIPHTLNFLAEFGFFTKDEWNAYSSAWGFLSAGDHPGVGDRDLARLSITLAMTFGHACLEKLEHWDGERFKF